MADMWQQWADMDMAAEMTETDDVAAGGAVLDWCGDDVSMTCRMTWIQEVDVADDMAGLIIFSAGFFFFSFLSFLLP